MKTPSLLFKQKHLFNMHMLINMHMLLNFYIRTNQHQLYLLQRFNIIQSTLHQSF